MLAVQPASRWRAGDRLLFKATWVWGCWGYWKEKHFVMQTIPPEGVCFSNVNVLCSRPGAPVILANTLPGFESRLFSLETHFPDSWEDPKETCVVESHVPSFQTC